MNKYTLRGLKLLLPAINIQKYCNCLFEFVKIVKGNFMSYLILERRFVLPLQFIVEFGNCI